MIVIKLLKNWLFKIKNKFKYLKKELNSEEKELHFLINDKLLVDSTLCKIAKSRNKDIQESIRNFNNQFNLTDGQILNNLKHTGFSKYAIQLWDLGIINCVDLISFNCEFPFEAYLSLKFSEKHYNLINKDNWKYIGIDISKYNNKKYYCIILAY